MARIADNLVIQRVEDVLVLIDDSTGAETTIPIEAGVRLTAMTAYLTNPNAPLNVFGEAIDQLKAVGAIQ